MSRSLWVQLSTVSGSGFLNDLFQDLVVVQTCQLPDGPQGRLTFGQDLHLQEYLPNFRHCDSLKPYKP